MKKSIILRLFTTIIIFLLALSGIFISIKIQKSEMNTGKNMIENTVKLTYKVKKWNRKTAEVLIKIKDNENGIEKIEYINDNHIENCYGAKIKARDCILQYGIEYKIKIKLKNENEKTETILINETDADIYVATTGDDITGNGTSEKPYATLAKAINMASDGNKIYIFPGTYNLEPIYNHVSMIRRCIFRNNRQWKKTRNIGS